jgi:hypothetical protein
MGAKILEGAWITALSGDEARELSASILKRDEATAAIAKIRDRAKKRLRRQERAAGNQTEQNKHT